MWVSVERENATSIYQALKAFGAPLVEMTEEDFAREGYFYQVGVAPVRVDILMSIPGLRFEPCWERRVEVDFDGVTTHFISKQDLIASKLAAGRPQDLLDVEVLKQAED